MWKFVSNHHRRRCYDVECVLQMDAQQLPGGIRRRWRRADRHADNKQIIRAATGPAPPKAATSRRRASDFCGPPAGAAQLPDFSDTLGPALNAPRAP